MKLRLAMTLLVVGSVFLFFIWGGKISFKEIFAALQTLSPSALIIPFILILLQILFRGTRLSLLLPSAYRISWWDTMRSFTLGQVANAYLPARAGDLIKIVSISRKAPVGQVVGSVLIADKWVDISSVILLVLVFGSGWMDEIFGQVSFSAFLKWGGIAFIIVITAAALSWKFIQSRLEWITRGFFEVLKGMSALINARQISLAYLTSFLGWFAEIFGLVAISQAFGVELSFAQALLAIVVLNLGIAVPVSFANLGAFEAALAFGLSHFGIETAQAIAIALVHHAFQIFCVMVWALGMISFRREGVLLLRLTSPDKR